MAIENISPEERLFKIIQENKNSPPKDRKGETDKAGRPTVLNWAGRLLGGIKRGRSGDGAVPAGTFGGLPVKLQNVDPKTINKALGVILIALLILVVYYVINKRYNIEKITAAVSSVPAQLPRSQAIEDFKPEQFYIAEVAKRDIFHPVGTNLKVETGKSTLKELTKDFSLAGIYQGEYPEAMIEDKNAKKTYFLKAGDEIKGIKVKSILKDGVILQYGEEEIEIF